MRNASVANRPKILTRQGKTILVPDALADLFRWYPSEGSDADHIFTLGKIAGICTMLSIDYQKLDLVTADTLGDYNPDSFDDWTGFGVRHALLAAGATGVGYATWQSEADRLGV